MAARETPGAEPIGDDPGLIERRALQLGVWASLAIAIAGVVAYALSASDALLLDGLYAGVMALTSVVAARIGAVVQRPPERSWPFGYGGQEALFVLFRSLLLLGPPLAHTPLAPLVPLSDPLLVILIALVVMVEPVQHFLEALRQTAGAACDPQLIAASRGRVQELLAGVGDGLPVRLLDFSLQKLGRTTFLLAWLDPGQSVDGAWMDGLRQRLEADLGELLGPLRCELLLTRQAPFEAEEVSCLLQPNPNP